MAKDQKFGRHDRAPSNKLQSQRTARNKRRHAERAHKMGMKQPGYVEYADNGKTPNNRESKMIHMCLSLSYMRNSRTHRPAT